MSICADYGLRSETNIQRNIMESKNRRFAVLRAEGSFWGWKSSSKIHSYVGPRMRRNWKRTQQAGRRSMRTYSWCRRSRQWRIPWCQPLWRATRNAAETEKMVHSTTGWQAPLELWPQWGTCEPLECGTNLWIARHPSEGLDSLCILDHMFDAPIWDGLCSPINAWIAQPKPGKIEYDRVGWGNEVDGNPFQMLARKKK